MCRFRVGVTGFRVTGSPKVLVSVSVSVSIRGRVRFRFRVVI